MGKGGISNFILFRERPPHSMELLPWLVGWRAVWALLSTSYYVPDETWQSVEVQDHFSCNHCDKQYQGGAQACFWKWPSHMGVGRGPQVSHPTISDSSPSSPNILISHGPLFLRSSLLPAFYSLPFFLVKFLHLDFQWLVVLLPR